MNQRRLNIGHSSATIQESDRMWSREPEPQRTLTDAELIQLERQLIPLLNTVRAMLGKRSIIAPK